MKDSKIIIKFFLMVEGLFVNNCVNGLFVRSIKFDIRIIRIKLI